MEWEFKYFLMPDYVDLSEPGKLKKKSGSKVYMRLNEETTLSSNYEMKVKVRNEIKNDAQMYIGVLDDYNWVHHISYIHDDGMIYDTSKGIKITTINAKLKKHSIIKVTNEIVTNEGETTNTKQKMF